MSCRQPTRRRTRCACPACQRASSLLSQRSVTPAAGERRGTPGRAWASTKPNPESEAQMNVRTSCPGDPALFERAERELADQMRAIEGVRGFRAVQVADDQVVLLIFADVPKPWTAWRPSWAIRGWGANVARCSTERRSGGSARSSDRSASKSSVPVDPRPLQGRTGQPELLERC